MAVELHFWLNLASVFTAILAAFFWLWASRIPIPDFRDSLIAEAFSPLQKASRLNAYAAACAGVSALLQAVLMILPE